MGADERRARPFEAPFVPLGEQGKRAAPLQTSGEVRARLPDGNHRGKEAGPYTQQKPGAAEQRPYERRGCVFAGFGVRELGKNFQTD